MNAELTEQLILVVHLLLALAIIGLIMLQQGKGADMGASFGAGASQTLFGSSGGGNVLTKTTAWMVTLFFATSFGLAVIAKNKTTSVDEFDLPIPESTMQEVPSGMDELPSSDVPEVPSSDIPALQSSEQGVDLESDLPEL
ncbi:MAG: preprotein translocase subunit SecG [Pseudomonadota bacterium]